MKLAFQLVSNETFSLTWLVLFCSFLIHLNYSSKVPTSSPSQQPTSLPTQVCYRCYVAQCILLDASYSNLLPCTHVLVQIPTSSPTGVPTSAVSSLNLYDMNAYEYMSKLILCIYYLSLLETLQPSNAPTSQPTSQPTDNPTNNPTVTTSNPTSVPTSLPSTNPTSNPTAVVSFSLILLEMLYPKLLLSVR